MIGNSNTPDLAQLCASDEKLNFLIHGNKGKPSTRPKGPPNRKAALAALLASLVNASGAVHSAASRAVTVARPQGASDLGMLRCPQVLALTGWSRSTLYNRISAAEFPPGVPLGPRTVGWPATEVLAYLAARVDERNARMQRQIDDSTTEAAE